VLEITKTLPKIVIAGVLCIVGKPDTYITKILDEFPEDLMDEYRKIIGDGLAKVTVGGEVSIKEYGTGASGFASVTLTCNQDELTIDKAAKLAGDFAKNYAHEHRAILEKELNQLLGGG